MLKTEYRIELTAEETEEAEKWLRERLDIAKEEKHEVLKEKLEALKKERPGEFRKLEYEFIQFVKGLRRTRHAFDEKELRTTKEPKKDDDEKRKKRRRTVPIYI